MTIARERYSGSDKALLETVEITDGITTLRYVMDHQDLVADTQVGSVTFTSLPMDADSLSDPPQADAGPQEISVTLDNVSGDLALFAYDVNRNNRAATLTRRTYREGAPGALQSYVMSIKSATYNTMQVTFNCGYMSVLDLAWPRRAYNLIDYPGIRYL